MAQMRSLVLAGNYDGARKELHARILTGDYKTARGLMDPIRKSSVMVSEVFRGLAVRSASKLESEAKAFREAIPRLLDWSDIEKTRSLVDEFVRAGLADELIELSMQHESPNPEFHISELKRLTWILGGLMEYDNTENRKTKKDAYRQDQFIDSARVASVAILKRAAQLVEMMKLETSHEYKDDFGKLLKSSRFNLAEPMKFFIQRMNEGRTPENETIFEMMECVRKVSGLGVLRGAFMMALISPNKEILKRKMAAAVYYRKISPETNRDFRSLMKDIYSGVRIVTKDGAIIVDDMIAFIESYKNECEIEMNEAISDIDDLFDDNLRSQFSESRFKERMGVYNRAKTILIDHEAIKKETDVLIEQGARRKSKMSLF